MKTPKLLITCGTSALFAAALSLQAQTSAPAAPPSSSATPPSSTTSGASTDASNANPGMSGSSDMSATPQSSAPDQTSHSGTMSGATTTPSTGSATQSTYYQSLPPNSESQSTAPNGGSQSMMNGQSMNGQSGMNGQSTMNGQSMMNNSPATNNSSAMNNSSTTNQSTSAAGSQQNFQQSQQSLAAGGVSTVSDAQVTTVVQQLDAAGPAVADELVPQVGELACSPQTVQNLVRALHDGSTVTLTADVNGQPQSATFNPNGAHVGYGEAYLAVAMAAQELRDSGITSCATPEQWQAALIGGSLTTASATTGPVQLPGIVTLRSQGQGWAQIAQTTHVQLGPVVSSIRTNHTAGAPTGHGPTMYRDNESANGTTQETAPKHRHQRFDRLFRPHHRASTSDTAPANDNPGPSHNAPANATPPASPPANQPNQ